MAGEAALQLPVSVVQRLLPDAAAQADAVARHIAGALVAAIAQRGQALLLLSGGRSPIAFFERLSLHDLAWEKVCIGLVDERCVGFDSPDRNDALVCRHLLQGKASVAQFVPLIGDGHDAAEELEPARRRVAKLPWPADVVVLGMGEDGHTASWFPGAAGTAAAMDAGTASQVAIVTPTTAPHVRLTLTLPPILQARQILLPIQGATKRAVVERAATATGSEFPVAAILQQQKTPLHLFYCP